MTPANRESLIDGAKGAVAISSAWGSNWFADKMAVIGVYGWGDLAQLLAAMLSVCLLAEFFWKRFLRKFANRRWPNTFPVRRYRRQTDFLDTSDSLDIE